MIGSIGDIGNLDRKVTLQQLVKGTGTIYSEPTETYQDVATVWGNKKPLSGREFFQARQVSAEVDTMFLIRWRSGVKATDRLVCEGLTYDIQHIAEVGRRVGLEILAKARQAQ